MTVSRKQSHRKTVMARDLRLADVVRTSIGDSHPFNAAIVKKITDDRVTLFRPYGVTADFSYTGGVICYTGIEEYEIDRDEQEYFVFERKTLS